jgi:hypothetical protein
MTRANLSEHSAQERLNQWVVFILAGGVSLLAFGAAAAAQSLFITFPILLFGSFAVVVVHELGHAIAAWMVGWRVWIIHAAPFVWRRHEDSVRFAGNLGGPDLGGFVLATPRTQGEDTKLRDCFVSAGGPLASWLMAGVLIAAAMFAQGDTYYAGDWRAGAYALGLLSLAVAIGSSLPILTRHGGNDAMHILAKLNRPPGHARPHAENALFLWRYGVEPAEWDDELRSSVEAARSRPASAFVPGFFDFVAAVRADDPRAARAALAALSASAGDASTAILEAYVQAAFEDDRDGADAGLAALQLSDVTEEDMVFRTFALAELSRLDGDVEGARKRLEDLKTRLRGQPFAQQPFWNELLVAAYARLGGHRLPTAGTIAA